ncbi:MAG: amino acid permease [Succinivibrionaceae bacterium]|nr:amino acid permease [Succinivibrionaceae bacterium]
MALNQNTAGSGSSGLAQYVTPLMAFAISVGCSIGWGAFVMPATTLLPRCGPLGTSIGMLVGALMILVIAANYHYLINRCRDSGGAFAFARRAFGYDHSFLCGVFLAVTYITMLWANGAVFAVLAGNVFGDVFKVGPEYSVAGYEVYFGEACLGSGAILLFSLVAMKAKSLAGALLSGFALVMIAGIAALMAGAASSEADVLTRLQPLFSHEASPVVQIWICLAFVPWAFVGFETLSNSAEEFGFSPKRSCLILTAAVIAITICYILVTLLSALAVPEQFSSWEEYTDYLRSENKSIPILILDGARGFLGDAGLPVAAVAILGALVTSIITNVIAASRLLFALGKDEILPAWFTRVNRNHVPSNAILFIILCSVGMPFFGRTVISWTVDMTTIGAVFAYAYTSAAAVKIAWLENFRTFKITGVAGLVISLFFMLFILIPHIFTGNTLESESYLMLAFWSIIGFYFFRVVFKKDSRFGNSSVVGIALLTLIFFALLMWVRQASYQSVQESVLELSEHYQSLISAASSQSDAQQTAASSQEFVSNQLAKVRSALHENSLIQFFSMVLALAIMFSVYSIIRRRELQMKKDKLNAEQSSKAKSTFLSNMSHDIRTPMNAIIGYTDIALQPGVTLEEIREYLKKISTSGNHLMDLVNDVLEMSRIESGKLELKLASHNIVGIADDVRDMFSNQMNKKHIDFVVDTSGVKDPVVLCDGHYIKRIIMNLVGNALKFTNEKGKVEFLLSQKEFDSENANGSGGAPGSHAQFDNLNIPDAKTVRKAVYMLIVRDNGIGMSQQFAEKVFEPFERERTSTVSGITGTGLGMAISKTLVDMMDGTIVCRTAPGKGTEFTVNVPMEIVDSIEENTTGAASGADQVSGAAPKQQNVSDVKSTDKKSQPASFSPDMYKGRRLLLAEDIAINREIAVMSLKRFGFDVETAENGRQAVDILSASEPGYFDAVLMDIQMPVMDGHTATKEIRKLANSELASIPIIAMTANAFVEDIEAEKESGMNGHISKPLNIPEMISTIGSVLEKKL